MTLGEKESLKLNIFFGPPALHEQEARLWKLYSGQQGTLPYAQQGGAGAMEKDGRGVLQESIASVKPGAILGNPCLILGSGPLASGVFHSSFF